MGGQVVIHVLDGGLGEGAFVGGGGGEGGLCGCGRDVGWIRAVAQARLAKRRDVGGGAIRGNGVYGWGKVTVMKRIRVGLGRGGIR